jgi:hypothetical protein
MLRLVLAFLLAAIVAHATGILGDGAPTLNSPWPLLFTIPAFLGVPILLAALLFGGLFYFACRRVDSDRPRLPKRIPLILALATIACAAYFIVSWGAGIEFQGKSFLYGCVFINTVAVLGLFAMWAINRWTAVPHSAIAFYFALFVWLGTYAFPYFGEGT